MGTRCRLTGLIQLGLLVFVPGCDSARVQPQPNPPSNAVAMDIDPALAKLLELQVDDKTLVDFVNSLEALAKKQDWEEVFAERKKRSFFAWEEARAVSIQTGQIQYVVVLLKSWTHTIPGDDTQLVILLDNQGNFLDQLDCKINARLSRMHFGQFHTVISTKPEPDGAQLVIRLDGESVRGNFAHYISHGGGQAGFYWGHDKLPEDQPTKWDRNGLCRIAIADGKFRVLFPGERDKEQPPIVPPLRP